MYSVAVQPGLCRTWSETPVYSQRGSYDPGSIPGRDFFSSPVTFVLHYENTPMQYTAIFHGCKKDNFQMKNCDGFLIVAQNIDCGYTLEPPQ